MYLPPAQLGVPIVALICQDCDEVYNDPEWVFSVVDEFEKHERGCDYWFEKSVEEIAPAGLKCPKCGGTHWAKEDDILDVWFDSGTSFAAVVEKDLSTVFLQIFTLKAPTSIAAGSTALFSLPWEPVTFPPTKPY